MAYQFNGNATQPQQRTDLLSHHFAPRFSLAEEINTGLLRVDLVEINIPSRSELNDHGRTIRKYFVTLLIGLIHIVDSLISIWVRALKVPMHLGLTNGSVGPHNLSAQGSPVTC